MKRFQLLLILFLNIGFLQGQNLLQRKIIVQSSVLGASITSQIALYNLWYKEFQSGKFHFFDDSKEWGYMDKFGHVYSAYQLSNQLNEVYQFAGYSKKQSLYLASTIGFLYQLNMELMDGYSQGWGFSSMDLVSNCIGLGLNLLQNSTSSPLFFPKFSYSPSPYAGLRPEVLGNSSISRILKDYNGQTYWISFKGTKLIESMPEWVLFSVGYRINERLVGSSNYYETENRAYRSYGQYLFSLDFDLSKIPVQNKIVKSICSAFNTLKVPFPTFSIEQQKIKLYPIYF